MTDINVSCVIFVDTAFRHSSGILLMHATALVDLLRTLWEICQNNEIVKGLLLIFILFRLSVKSKYKQIISNEYFHFPSKAIDGYEYLDKGTCFLFLFYVTFVKNSCFNVLCSKCKG